MKNVNINVKFVAEIRPHYLTGYAAEIPGPHGVYETGLSVGTVKKRLLAKMTARVNDAIEAFANDRRKLVACNDGTSLLVEFRHGSWGYSILRPDGTAGSGVCGIDGYDKALEYAQDHAAQSYGGVKVETRI